MTRIEFIEFLKEFKNDVRENRTTEDFIEAMAAYTNDVQGYYDNNNLNINADEASWENFKMILQGASCYE